MKTTWSRPTHDSLFNVLRPVIKLDARHLVVLVALVVAVIDRRTSVLHSLKTHVQLPGTPEVRKKRLSRFMQCQLPEHLLIHLVIPLLIEGDFELTLDRTNWKFGVLNINFLILGAYWKGTCVFQAYAASDSEVMRQSIPDVCATLGG